MKCPKCYADNPDTSRFCGNCAALLAQERQLPNSLTKTLATPLHVISKDSLIAGKYRIVEEIGRGGMGVVYKAEDLKLKRPVALKFLPPHLMDSPELKERFLIEAQAAAALSHPNICVIHEVGESEGRFFIAMEYVEGETLRDKIKNAPLKTEEALDITIQVAAGLGEAHRKGIIHRDIKSANIMVTEKGQAKVMDFGLAKLRGGSSLTKSQTTLGTVAYMSPEQARGDELDGRTDIWSLGVVLYEILTGEQPFKGDHDQSVIHSILHEEPRSPKKARPNTAPELEQVVSQALAKKPADRYQSMEEFRDDLEAVAEGLKPLKARPAKEKIFGIKKIYVYTGLAALAALFVLNIAGVRDRILGRSGLASRAIKLAVLPFVNLTGDPEQEYLSDGLTQEMIAQLGRLHPQSLSVIARTSVMRYKKTDTPIDQIGRELGVDYVLEGSARREAGRVRISAELIQVRDQTQLWADTYERDMSGILALQNEVTQKVAGALALMLLPSEQARLANARVVNPEAYDAYLKASQYWIKLTTGDLDTAERYLNLALEKDPGFASAYAGISIVWACRQQAGFTPPSEAGPKAKTAALKALELDDTVADAHYALATVLTWTDWDFAAAEREWQRAVELNPGDAQARAFYSHFLMNVRRPDEAMAQIELALKGDPFNVIIQSFYAVDLLFMHRYDDVIAAAREALRLQPGAPVALEMLWFAYSFKAMPKEAIEGAKGYLMSIYGDREVEEALDQGYAEAGYAEGMKRAAEALDRRFRVSFVLPTDIAFLYIEARENVQALEWLEKAFEVRDPAMPYLGLPNFDSLRSDPRFQDLFRRMNLQSDRK